MIRYVPVEVYTSTLIKGENEGYVLSATVRKGQWQNVIVADCGHTHKTRKEAAACTVDIPKTYDVALESGDVERLVIKVD